jgi:hypothetical protein
MEASSQTFKPVAVTVMTPEVRDSLDSYFALQSNIKAEALVTRLTTRYKMAPASAWILACRFLNEKRDNG